MKSHAGIVLTCALVALGGTSPAPAAEESVFQKCCGGCGSCSAYVSCAPPPCACPPRRCGPIRRLLHRCCRPPVISARPCYSCPPVVVPGPPVPAGPVVAPPAFPAPPAAAPPAVTEQYYLPAPPVKNPPAVPDPQVRPMPQPPLPPVTEGTNRPIRPLAPVPPRPLTPPLPPTGVHLDRLASAPSARVPVQGALAVRRSP